MANYRELRKRKISSAGADGPFAVLALPYLYAYRFIVAPVITGIVVGAVAVIAFSIMAMAL